MFNPCVITNEYIAKAFQSGQPITPEYMEQAVASIREALAGSHRVQQQRFPRASALGHQARRLWFMRTQPDVTNDLSGLATTFFMGHVLEAFEIMLMQQAGIKISGFQAAGNATFGGIDVSGGIDCEIEDEDGNVGVYDIKSTNDYKFQSVWKDATTLAANDTYGYIAQAAVYEEIRSKPFLGWIVINKNNGERKFVPSDDVRSILDAKKISIADNLKRAYEESMPEQCYPYVPEVYHPQADKQLGLPATATGNVKLDSRCAYCPYVKQCFPDAVYATRGRSDYYYIKPVNKQSAPKGVKFYDDGI